MTKLYRIEKIDLRGRASKVFLMGKEYKGIVQKPYKINTFAIAVTDTVSRIQCTTSCPIPPTNLCPHSGARLTGCATNTLTGFVKDISLSLDSIHFTKSVILWKMTVHHIIRKRP